MAWETRNCRRYFYFSQRLGNRVRRMYVGTGDVGRAAELSLEKRKIHREQVRRWMAWAKDAFSTVDLIDAVLNVELAAVLMTRGKIQLEAKMARRRIRNNVNYLELEVPADLSPDEQAEWKDLCIRASRGEKDAVSAVTKMLRDSQAPLSRWGDLSRVALSRWLEIVGEDPTSQQALLKEVQNLVKSVQVLDGDTLEETMARRIGILWLQVTYFDTQMAMSVRRDPREQALLAKRQKESQVLYNAALLALQQYQTGAARYEEKRSGDSFHAAPQSLRQPLKLST